MSQKSFIDNKKSRKNFPYVGRGGGDKSFLRRSLQGTTYCCCINPSNRQDYMVSSMNMLDNKQVLLKSCNNFWLMTIGDIVDKWWWLMIIMINLIILIMVPDKLTTLDAKRSLSSSVDCTFVSENVWDYEEHLVELHFNQAMTFGLTKYWKNFENLSIWVIFEHLV